MTVASFLQELKRFVPFKGMLKPPFRFLRRAIRRRRVARYVRTLAPRADGPRVLVAMNAGIGNAVEATPLVQAIRMLWPGAELTLYAPPGDLFAEWCVVDGCVVRPEGLTGRSFDHTFLPFTSPGLPPEAGARTGRIHGGGEWFIPFLRPEREYDLDLARECGYSGATPPLYVSIREPAVPVPVDETTICLCPGGAHLHKWRNKRWPYHADLADMLLAAHDDLRICILGTEDDAMETRASWGDRVLDLRGRLTLAEAAWVLDRSRLAIGNDCGPMHLASAVGTHSVTIFGPTCELKNGPPARATIICAGVPCRPCQYGDLLETCEDPVCMTGLRAEEVFTGVERIIGSVAR